MNASRVAYLVGRIGLIGTGLAAAVLHAADARPIPLADPLPEKIAASELIVAAVEFVRAPGTFDPSKPATTNDAHARIQYLLPLPDGSQRLAFNDLRGQLYLTDSEGSPPKVYLDLRSQDVDFHNAAFPNEAGFLGFAFHPHFAVEGKPGYGKLYTAFSAGPDSGTATYVDESGKNQESVIREWTTANPAADAFQGESREVLRVGQFSPTHNIGTLAFNPTVVEGDDDFGLLYICFGDGGGRDDPKEYAQNLAVPLGAIARIDPLPEDGRGYGIPADNPFVGVAGAAPEIWAYGLRHPQQFSWGPDGRMFIGDIGQDQVEEVNIGVPGGNYGWRLREGTFATAFGVDAVEIGSVFARPPTDPLPFIYPVAQYDHDEGFAIAGGFVYQGEAIPELRGKYVFTDIAKGRVFVIATDELRPGDPVPIEELRIAFDGQVRAIADVAGFTNTYHGPEHPRADLRLGLDHAGELYLLTKGDGWIRKLVPASDAARAPGP